MNFFAIILTLAFGVQSANTQAQGGSGNSMEGLGLSEYCYLPVPVNACAGANSVYYYVDNGNLVAELDLNAYPTDVNTFLGQTQKSY